MHATFALDINNNNNNNNNNKHTFIYLHLQENQNSISVHTKGVKGIKMPLNVNSRRMPI